MSPTETEKPRFCSRCGRPVVVADAVFCKECGAPLAPQAWIRRDITWRPTVAAALSLVPGLGHLYRGHPWKAIAWFVGVAMAYPLAYPLGFVLHLVCAGNAALSGAIQENAVVRGSGGRGAGPGRLPASIKPGP
jgi:hypothetical protein